MNKNSFRSSRSRQTSLMTFENATSSSCPYVMKEAHEISFNEAFRLRYRFHERHVENVHTGTTEKE